MTTASSLAQHNADVVGGIYAAFGRGDIPAMLEAIADDARLEEWAEHSTNELPYLRPRRGPEGFAEFLAEIADWTPHSFDILDVIAGERQVAVEVRVDWQLPNGRRLADEELHLWTIGEHGKVARMRHYIDTARHLAAHAD